MRIIRCQSCDALSEQQAKIKNGLSALCPCCGDKVSRANSLSTSGEIAIILTAFLLFFPAQYLDLVSINLLGVPLSTSVASGALSLFSNFPIVSVLIIFCAVIAPLSYLLSLAIAHVALHIRSHKLLFVATAAIKSLRNWVMIDVFMVSLAVASFKVNDFSNIIPDFGLVCFVGLQIMLTILLSRVSTEKYWDKLYPTEKFDGYNHHLPLNATLTCENCHLTQDNSLQHCLRCFNPIAPRKEQSLQKTWAFLITATIFIFPANLYPISVLLTNGKRMEDTIISGVALLINSGLYGIAAIIFIASIAVPVAKIIGLGYLLACIHYKRSRAFRFRTKVYHFVHGIGKWSMMDLFVIAILVSLLNRGNLLGFTPGFGATAFGLVVIFTMLATKSLDPRLIWDVADQNRLAKYHRQKISQDIENNNNTDSVQAGYER